LVFFDGWWCFLFCCRHFEKIESDKKEYELPTTVHAEHELSRFRL
jgi:hypothetical protein